ncbi:hypothetical protein LCGC14_1311180 [marine sediment metagenome]|uniref:Uncharacterized protein n=1 Tax=marine sediment metagenome TaxID=412755 RepID=A0A0F9L7C6_9ZZZZ
MATEKRKAFFVMETRANDQGEYQALIAVEDEKGYHPTDWFWGTDLAAAETIAEERNAKMGIDSAQAWNIVASTMRQ